MINGVEECWGERSGKELSRQKPWWNAQGKCPGRKNPTLPKRHACQTVPRLWRFWIWIRRTSSSSADVVTHLPLFTISSLWTSSAFSFLTEISPLGWWIGTVISKLLRRHSKAKLRTPAYTRRLQWIRGAVQRVVHVGYAQVRMRECQRRERESSS